MFGMTALDIEDCIRAAEASGIPEDELQQLREDLEDAKAGMFANSAESFLVYQEVNDSERLSKTKSREVRVSTAHSYADDFEGVTLKPIRNYSFRGH